MKRIILLLTFCIGSFSVYTQTNIDSLINVLETHTLTNEKKIELYNDIFQSHIKNEPETAFSYAEKGLSFAHKTNNRIYISRFMTNYGEYYSTKSNYDTAIVYFNRALNISTELDNKNELTNIFIKFAQLYARQSKHETALKYYFKALPIAENIQNMNFATTILNDIGGTYDIMNNPTRAIYYLEKAVKLADEHNIINAKLKAYYHLGVILGDKGEIEKALDYANKLANSSRLYDNKVFEIAAMDLLAVIYLYDLKDADKGEEYANKALTLAKEYNDPMILSGIWKLLANVYRHQKKFEECETVALNAWNIDSTSIELGENLAFHIAVANTAIGNHEKAYYFFKKYELFINERTNSNYHTSLTDMEIKYETEKKEMRIATLEKEKRHYTWLGISGITLLLMAFCILLYQHRLNIQKRKNVEQQKELTEKQMILARQQREIAEQENELAEQKINQLEKEKQLVATQSMLEGETTERIRLARDLHDGLGGMLSVVRLNLKEIGKYSVLGKQDIKRFDKAFNLLNQSMVELRRVAHHLMPDTLMRYGLRTSMEDFCNSIPTARFQYLGSNKRLGQRLEIVLYRCAHELVNNALKYANATIIHVQLIIDDELVSLTVQDDGIGFDPDQVASGSGLDNIRARVSACNGNMTIHSSSDKGAEINIEFENINS